MVRKNIYVREDQIESLASLQGQESEQIRIAIDEYIAKRRHTDVSMSPSQMKGGVFSGRDIRDFTSTEASQS